MFTLFLHYLAHSHCFFKGCFLHLWKLNVLNLTCPFGQVSRFLCFFLSFVDSSSSHIYPGENVLVVALQVFKLSCMSGRAHIPREEYSIYSNLDKGTVMGGDCFFFGRICTNSYILQRITDSNVRKQCKFK
ncbi:unnamed protein product [Eruca vesicaria subsp. sativa]|uniref:Secreted protein n=1 Tax=Eruca vesicaria subsp. sativa TaxID=29727 RepID=A0ABC8L189_ERUVS|nr:unnamed protein product [Eruca vesicaria subsp. sativa]